MEHVERDRILEEYRRREAAIAPERYARSNPAEIFIREERVSVARRQLELTGRFPTRDSLCLEIGCGKGGWLPELSDWGVEETNMCGVDLSGDRLHSARVSIPDATLALADARSLPWRDDRFDLIVLSTVLSSVLDSRLRATICQEAARVLHPGGALLVYDFQVDNPKNPNVQRVKTSELERLLAPLEGQIASVTLAPPLLRNLLPAHPGIARSLSRVPVLRTHFMACFTRGGTP